GCASGTGSIHSRPFERSGKERRKGEATAIGWMAEQTSWTNPGAVSSALRAPPPTESRASRTRTERPACASATAALRPFGPEPITTASSDGAGTALSLRARRARGRGRSAADPRSALGDCRGRHGAEDHEHAEGGDTRLGLRQHRE